MPLLRPKQPASASAIARPSARRRRLLKGAGALVLALIMAELVLRFVFGLGNPVLYRADPSTSYIVAPSQNVWRYFARNRTNRYGMRSDEVKEPKPAGELRVMVVGDSVVYGPTRVDQSDLFTTLLAAELPARAGRPVEILNASAGGWAVANELAYLKSRGIFSSDIVLLVMNEGDLSQPFSDAAPGPADSHLPGVRPPLGMALAELWLKAGSYLTTARLNMADPGSSPPSPGSAPVAEVLPSVLADVGSARRLVESAGATFILVYVPGRPGDWTDPEWPAGEATLRRWAKDQGIVFLDLTPDLSPAPPKQTYFDAQHLRPPGHRIVADAILREWPRLTAPALPASGPAEGILPH